MYIRSIMKRELSMFADKVVEYASDVCVSKSLIIE